MTRDGSADIAARYGQERYGKSGSVSRDIDRRKSPEQIKNYFASVPNIVEN
jgi:hypothetical protein